MFNLASAPLIAKTESVEVETKLISGKDKLDTIPLPIILNHTNQTDWHFAKHLIQPNMAKGPWIAGGCIRRIHEGVSLRGGDVDVFVSSKKMADEVIKRLIIAGLKHTVAYPTCHTYKSADGLEIQVITGSMYSTMNDLLADFDISVSQFASDGEIIVTTAQSVTDCYERVFRFTGRVTKGFKRLRKYIKHGFLPEFGVWDRIAEGKLSRYVNGKILDEPDY